MLNGKAGNDGAGQPQHQRVDDPPEQAEGEQGERKRNELQEKAERGIDEPDHDDRNQRPAVTGDVNARHDLCDQPKRHGAQDPVEQHPHSPMVLTGRETSEYHFAMRISLIKTAPGAMQAMAGLEHYLKDCGLEKPLLELVKIRASQINGCAFCLDMHTLDARAAGETEQRLHLVAAWEEAPFFNDRERAALAWTEAVTRISETHAPDALYDKLRAHFSEKEIADLTLAIATINAWNRLMIAFRVPAGIYKPKSPQTTAS